jgi:arylsulfatase
MEAAMKLLCETANRSAPRLNRWLRHCHITAGILGVLSLLPFPAVADRPNIVVILADDMGYSDIGCYGSEIETPQLDRLAAAGLRFTQFYNTGRCCPTRASLLTGLYPHQAGIGHMMDDRGFPGYRGDLNDHCLTIAEALRPAGYRSYAAGKWHVTKQTRPTGNAEKHNWPLQRGFDRFYGTIHGAGSFFDPNSLVRDNQLISPYADPEYRPTDYYYTDAIADHAVRFVREHEGDEPFFLYAAFTAAHWPMHALPADIAKYSGHYAAGYAAVRQARYRRMLDCGVIAETATPLWPLDPAWGEQGTFWPWDERNMEVYAAMVESLDRGIGRIVDSLEETGQLDNTLICYLQDNGGCAETMGRGKPGPARAASPPLPPMAADALQHDMIPVQTRDGFPVRQGKGVMAGPADTYIGYGKAWATVSNTPFRRYKHWVHEGGIATPLIVHWPAGIANAGRLEQTPGHLIDIMATAVDLAAATYPGDKTPLEGISLAPLFRGQTLPPRTLYWEHEGNRAVRAGNWKLVAGFNEPWTLHDISTDRTETHDLSDQYPDKAASLAAAWDAYATRADVVDWRQVRPQRKQKAAGNQR